jgi:hypothetical protein
VPPEAPATPSTIATSSTMTDDVNPFSFSASPQPTQLFPGLFGNSPVSTAITKPAEGGSVDALIEKAKAEANRQNMNLRIEFVRPKEQRSGLLMAVVITPFNSTRGEAHWCWRPTTFNEVFELARRNGNAGIPIDLLECWAISMPQRSASDRKVQKERTVKGIGGGLITIKENVLIVFLDPSLNGTALEERVVKIIDGLSTKEVKALYSTFLEKSSKKVKDEVNPDNGAFWTMLDCAKLHREVIEHQQLDDIVTTGAAMHLVQNMYKLTVSSWGDWPAPARAFASIYGP